MDIYIMGLFWVAHGHTTRRVGAHDTILIHSLAQSKNILSYHSGHRQVGSRRNKGDRKFHVVLCMVYDNRRFPFTLPIIIGCSWGSWVCTGDR